MSTAAIQIQPKESTAVSTAFSFTDIMNNDSTFNKLMQVSEFMAKSNIVPRHFQGNPASCFIALQYALRVKADPFQVMQASYVVHGKFSMEAKFIIALINQSGIFKSRLKFRYEGEGQNRKCTAYVTDHDGDVLESTYEFQTAVKEGLVGKDGSKWKTMPDLMLSYRAASQFSRIHCPELNLGMPVADERTDFDPIDVTDTVTDPTPQPDRAAAAPQIEPPAQEASVTVDQIREEYKGWKKERQDIFNGYRDNFKQNGWDDDKCVTLAYDKLINNKYVQ